MANIKAIVKFNKIMTREAMENEASGILNEIINNNVICVPTDVSGVVVYDGELNKILFEI